MRTAIDHNPGKIIDLDEGKAENVLKFVSHVLGDMEYEEQVLHEPLNVFSWIR